MSRREFQRKTSWVFKAARDGIIGFAVYGIIAAIALEDRAQAGHALIIKPGGYLTQSGGWTSDSSLLTLAVVGFLFAALTAFTLGAWRHFGQTIVLSRVRPSRAPGWSKTPNGTYLSRR